MALPAAAGNLVFPKQGAAAKEAIGKDCPTCMASGVALCGTVDVQFGKRLGAGYFFAGKPKRGYLPGFRLSGEEFRALARSMPYDGVMQSLKQSFESLPAARVLFASIGPKLATHRLSSPSIVTSHGP